MAVRSEPARDPLGREQHKPARSAPRTPPGRVDPTVGHLAATPPPARAQHQRFVAPDRPIYWLVASAPVLRRSTILIRPAHATSKLCGAQPSAIGRRGAELHLTEQETLAVAYQAKYREYIEARPSHLSSADLLLANLETHPVVGVQAAAAAQLGVVPWRELGCDAGDDDAAAEARADRLTQARQQASGRCRSRDRAGASSSPRISSRLDESEQSALRRRRDARLARPSGSGARARRARARLLCSRARRRESDAQRDC